MVGEGGGGDLRWETQVSCQREVTDGKEVRPGRGFEGWKGDQADRIRGRGDENNRGTRIAAAS
jgi:hypothetical protein